MENLKKLDGPKQAKRIENHKKVPMRNTRSQIVTKPTSPSRIKHEKNPSDMTQRSLLESVRNSPIKTPERTRSTVRNESHKYQDENCCPLQLSGPRISRHLFAANRIPLRTTGSKPHPAQDSRNIKLTPSKIPSISTIKSKPTKIRSPVSTDLFRPINRIVEDTESKIYKEISPILNDKSSDEHYDLSDWELIDWPWVAHYAPYEGKVPLLSTKSQGISLTAQSESCSICSKTNAKYPCIQNKLSQNQTGDPNHQLMPYNGFCTDNLPKQSLYRIPPRRRELTSSDPVVRPPTPVPIVKAPSPSCTYWDEDSQIVYEVLKESLNLDGKKPFTRALIKDVSNFIKSISHMDEEDRRSMIGFLDLLNNLQKGSNSYNTDHHEKKKNQKADNSSPSQKKLNPKSPEFEPNIFSGLNHSRQSIEYLRQNRESQDSQQKSKGFNINSHNPVGPTILNIDSIQNGLSDDFCQPEPSLFENSNVAPGTINQDGLLEACSNKLNTIEFFMQGIPTETMGQPQNPLPRLVYKNLTGQPKALKSPEIIVGSDEPGRVANALDISWAHLMLQKYREKYPNTGTKRKTAISSAEEPIISEVTDRGLSKSKISELQQRIEFCLLMKKEKQAQQRWCMPITGSF